VIRSSKDIPNTRKEISNGVGGSVEAYLPTKNGAIVSGCFTLEVNPNAPLEVLPRDGPGRLRSAEVFSSQGNPVPIFIKQEAFRWNYVGLWRCVSKSAQVENLEQQRQRTGRQDITMVLKL
jgi:hypothetical protein